MDLYTHAYINTHTHTHKEKIYRWPIDEMDLETNYLNCLIEYIVYYNNIDRCI